MRDSSRRWIDGLFSVLGDALLDAISPRLNEHEKRLSREIEELRKEIRNLAARLERSEAPEADSGKFNKQQQTKTEPKGTDKIHHGSRLIQGDDRHQRRHDPDRAAQPSPAQVSKKAPREPGPVLAPPPKCKQPGCWRNAYKDGYCKQHYQMFVLKPLQEEQERRRREATMTVAEYKEVERRLLEKAKELKQKEEKLKQEAIEAVKDGARENEPGGGAVQASKSDDASKDTGVPPAGTKAVAEESVQASDKPLETPRREVTKTAKKKPAKKTGTKKSAKKSTAKKTTKKSTKKSTAKKTAKKRAKKTAKKS